MFLPADSQHVAGDVEGIVLLLPWLIIKSTLYPRNEMFYHFKGIEMVIS